MTIRKLAADKPEASYRIIVVDDDPLVARCMADMLKWLGHTVITFSTPRGVLRQINETQPDMFF